MGRKNYRTKEARIRHTVFDVNPPDEYTVMMTNGHQTKAVTVSGTSEVNARNRAIRQGLTDADDVWWPTKISNDRGWSYS